MSALRLARAYTKRPKILKFIGNYHGHSDSFLISAGSGAATQNVPDSPGVCEGVVKDTIVAEYNSEDSVKGLFELFGKEIAAVIVEPVVGNSGFIKPKPYFLEFLREITIDHASLLIFDEVMTGFRVGYGGAQQYYGVVPDLTTLGKIIGGGLPVGAYGGSSSIMSLISPSGPVYQAGTLSGNPLAMNAGICTLEQLLKEGIYEELERKCQFLINGLVKLGKQHNQPIYGDYAGGMMGWFFTDKRVENYNDAKKCNGEMFTRWHEGMLRRGIYLAPSQYEAGFMSLSHTDEDIGRTLEKADEVIRGL